MEETIQARPKSYKTKVIITLLVVLLSAVGYAYYWYSGIMSMRAEAEAALQERDALKAQAESYISLKEAIRTEYDRCQEFITRQEGNFGSFEYCKRYLEWAKSWLGDSR